MERSRFNICEFILKNKAYFLAAGLPVLILFVADIIFGIFPFGDRSPLALDLNAQYVYYYEYMYDVLGGKESLFYSWSRSLSGEFIGLFAYYLASPFNFIVWMFPRSNITEGLLAMQLVKAAAVGLSSAFYLKKQRGFSDLTTIIFSVSFAMCGYFTAHTINPMWLDGLIALPLVIAGVERVCDKRNFLLYTLSLVYIFIANYYIGYMIGIFSAMYFLYYLLSKRTAARGWRESFKAVFVYGLSSLSAILMSCPILIPVYKSLSVGKLVYNDPGSTLADNFKHPAENFNIADILIKLFPGTYDTIRPEGLPMLYCGTAALIFAVIYFASGKTPLRQRIAGGSLLGLMVISMYVKPVDMLWHGGQVPVWMPFRYSFIITFLLVIFGAEAFENFREDKSTRIKQIGVVFASLLAVLLMADYYEGYDRFDTTLIILVPLVCLGIMSALIACFKKNRGRVAASVALSIFVCTEMLLNTDITLFKTHEDVYYSSRDSYVNEIPPARAVMDELKELDSGFYRSEKTFHRTVNDPQALGMYGISHSSSTYNAKVIALLKKLGFGARDHYTRYDGATMLTDDILGFKYVLSKRDDLVPYTDTVLTNGDITVYENSDALPLVYLADVGVIGSLLPSTDPFTSQTALAQILSGETAEFYHPITDTVFDSQNISIGSTTDDHISYKKRDKNSSANVSYNVRMPHDGKAYVYFPTYYERECGLYVNGRYNKNYFENENYTIAYLGCYSEGETFDVKLELYKEDMYIREAMFFYLDEDELARFNKTMTDINSGTTVTRTEHSSLEITVNTDRDRALFMTIPIEDGWSAYIDGEPVKIYPAADSTLMAVRVPGGQHTITLKFFPAGLSIGLIIMIFGAAIFACLILIPRLLPKKSVPDGNMENIDNAAEIINENGGNEDGQH